MEYDNDKLKKVIEEFLSLFDYDQLRQIKLGIENGLSLDQILVYAHRKFSADQMGVIRNGLERGLSIEKVRIYADKRFNYKQMKEIMLGLLHGLREEDVRFYADERFHELEMEQIRLGLENGLPLNVVKIYANNKKYDYSHMFILRTYLQNNYKGQEIDENFIKEMEKKLEVDDRDRSQIKVIAERNLYSY